VEIDTTTNIKETEPMTTRTRRESETTTTRIQRARARATQRWLESGRYDAVAERRHHRELEELGQVTALDIADHGSPQS
jgi:hypothetical protein